MALTGEELEDEVRTLVGRAGSDTQGVITDTRVTRWLNESQVDIAEACPGLEDKKIYDTSSFSCASDTPSYSFASFCDGYKVCYEQELWFWDGNDSFLLDYLPPDEFDSEYPDFTSTDYSPTKPKAWTRRGSAFYVAPLMDETYTGTTLRFVYAAYAQDFTTNDANTSQIANIDDGLIYYGTAKAWGAIGNKGKQDEWMLKFSNTNPNAEFGWLERFKAHNDSMQAWDGLIFDSV